MVSYFSEVTSTLLLTFTTYLIYTGEFIILHRIYRNLPLLSGNPATSLFLTYFIGFYVRLYYYIVLNLFNVGPI